MKRTLSMLLLVIAAVQFAKAQGNNLVGGSVQGASGKPLRFVFVGDLANKNAVFTDTLGNFRIAVKPGTRLEFECFGFRDTSLSVKPGTPVQLVLSGTHNDNVAATAVNSSGQPLTSLTKNEVATISNDMGGYLKPAHEKGDTRGSQYLFQTFVPGYMINPSGELVHKSNFLFDYDKIGGNLLLTRDNKTIIAIDETEAPRFSLFSNTNQRFDFENVPAIDKTHYVEVLASGDKYKIYKLIRTRFAKADYVNNGPAAHGHDYDEYIDEPDYYVVEAQSNQPQKFSLRKKSIKEAFAKDADKVSKFLSDNSGKIDDAWLSKLGNYMNQ
jgi:hypothetical protein